MKVLTKNILFMSVVMLNACGGGGSGGADISDDDGGSGSDVVDVDPIGSENGIVEISGLATGTTTDPASVYYDIDTATVMGLDAEQAAASDDWDIAFNRTEIYLNASASVPVSLYFTDNVDAFYDENGAAISTQFINADPLTVLADFENLIFEIPEDDAFHTDRVVPAIDDFYVYNPVDHTATENANAYFVVSSDDALTKFRVVEIIQEGFGMSSISLELAYQADGESLFSSPEILIIDGSECASDAYIDFDSMLPVANSEDWDIKIPCADGALDFQIDLADDALALSGENAELDGIDNEVFPYFDWTENQNKALAYVEYGDSRSQYGWGEYGINGGHVLWPNFATYLIKTAQGIYKFQVTSYYDAESGASGSYSIRHQKVSDDE